MSLNKMNSKSIIKKFGRLSLLALAVSGSIHAAEISKTNEFNIQAGTLKQALNQYMKQSGKQIVFLDSHIENIDTQGLSGTLSNENALNQLLRNTQLDITVDKSTGAILVKPKAKESSKQVTSPAEAAITKKQQTSVQNNTDNVEEETEVVTVTGSRIFGVAPVSPVVTLTSEEFEKRGLTSVEDVIKYLPQNFSSTNSSSHLATGAAVFSEGSSSVNLRGLGESETLILVNGKRISNSISSSSRFTDVSTIPFAAIERVEVITDGASAIYGSDAVAGVVNFILKSDYDGYKITARYENSSNDADGYSIEQSGGISWDTGNLTASLTLKKTDPINSYKAGLSDNIDHRAEGGRFWTRDAIGQPGLLNNGVYFLDNAPGINPPIRAFIPGDPSAFAAILPAGDGTNVGVDDLLYISRADAFNQTGNFNLLSKRSHRFSPTASPELEQTSFHATLLQEITDDIELDITGIYSKRENFTERVAHSVTKGVPESNFYNNFGQDVHVLNYAFYSETDAGLIRKPNVETDVSRYNIAAGITWDLPYKDWIFDASVSFGADENESGTETLDLQTNPQVWNAIISDDPNEALNLFGDGSVQRANLNDLLTRTQPGKLTSEQEVYSLGLNGTIINYYAGDIKFSTGAERRVETSDFSERQNNPVSNQTELSNFSPESVNTSYFGELFVPLVSEKMSVPFVQHFALQLASRYDKYEYEGPFNGVTDRSDFTTKTFSDTTNKVGLLWLPNDELKVTYSWGQAFRAPNMLDLFRENREAPFPFAVRDPLDPDGRLFVFPSATIGGNPDLESQTSVSNVVAFDYNPKWLEGLRLNVVWNETKYDNLIATAISVFGDSTFALENAEQFPSLVERDADGYLIRYDQFIPRNLSSQISESLDFQIEYSFNTSVGDFTLGAFATRTIRFESQASVDSDPLDRAGTELGPSKWRSNLTIDWYNEQWSANAKYQYSSSYELTDELAVTKDVDSSALLNVQVNYRMEQSGWNFTGGIDNLLDPDLPFIDNTFGVDTSRANLRGRVFYFNVSKEFDF